MKAAIFAVWKVGQHKTWPSKIKPKPRGPDVERIAACFGMIRKSDIVSSDLQCDDAAFSLADIELAFAYFAKDVNEVLAAM